MELLEKWIYECLGVLIKEPTEENRKIVAKTIANEIEDREKEFPHWHNLIKDPKDLPKSMGEYPCITDGGKLFSECYKVCCDSKPRWNTMNEIIAWYDLPKFEK